MNETASVVICSGSADNVSVVLHGVTNDEVLPLLLIGVWLGLYTGLKVYLFAFSMRVKSDSGESMERQKQR